MDEEKGDKILLALLAAFTVAGAVWYALSIQFCEGAVWIQFQFTCQTLPVLVRS